MKQTVALYVRVSTDKQEADNQLIQLREFAKKSDWDIVKEYVEITDGGLTIIDAEGERRTLAADSIIPALPLTPDTSLYERLDGKVPELYAVGDCREPLLIADAVGAGMETARSI